MRSGTYFPKALWNSFIKYTPSATRVGSPRAEAGNNFIDTCFYCVTLLAVRERFRKSLITKILARDAKKVLNPPLIVHIRNGDERVYVYAYEKGWEGHITRARFTEPVVSRSTGRLITKRRTPTWARKHIYTQAHVLCSTYCLRVYTRLCNSCLQSGGNNFLAQKRVSNGGKGGVYGGVFFLIYRRYYFRQRRQCWKRTNKRRHAPPDPTCTSKNFSSLRTAAVPPPLLLPYKCLHVCVFVYL